MSFYGKKFRRVRQENVDAFCKATNSPAHIAKVLEASSTIISYSKNDDGSITYTMETDGQALTTTFRLGVPHDTLRRDGTKVNIIYTMPDENTLCQLIVQQDGRIARFRREFYENEVKMVIAMEGHDITATIYYQLEK